jgi:hypothetical protein
MTRFLKPIALALTIYLAAFGAMYWHCSGPKGWQYSSASSLDIVAYALYWPVYKAARSFEAVRPHWRDPVYDYCGQVPCRS